AFNVSLLRTELSVNSVHCFCGRRPRNDRPNDGSRLRARAELDLAVYEGHSFLHRNQPQASTSQRGLHVESVAVVSDDQFDLVCAGAERHDKVSAARMLDGVMQ